LENFCTFTPQKSAAQHKSEGTQGAVMNLKSIDSQERKTFKSDQST
jgi:hypothetical protein